MYSLKGLTSSEELLSASAVSGGLGLVLMDCGGYSSASSVEHAVVEGFRDVFFQEQISNVLLQVPPTDARALHIFRHTPP